MKLPIQPPALAELEAAIEFYESRQPGLGLDLLDAVSETITFAAENPATGESSQRLPDRYEARRFLVRRFPYVVHVALLDGRREVFAIAHTSRRPGYWKNRLK